MNTQRTVHLIPPSFAPDQIKEKIICIRAHRERIFNISVQVRADKLIFHNYGQGGAGWTFLFGCVNASIRQFEEQIACNPALHVQPIAVIGAGCYGLLTAIMLARKGYCVRVIAKEMHDIPSHKAAGFFFPRPRKVSTVDEAAIFNTLGMQSYKEYLEIINGEHAFMHAGPKLLPGYFALDIDPGFGPYIAQGLMQRPEKVTVNFGNGKMYDAMEYTTVFINSTIMMQELHRNVRELGIAITNAQINSFDEFAEAIVFNCAGLGAKNLTDDKRIIPVQGHLITLCNQPSMEHLQYMVNVKVTQLNPRGMPRDELIYYAPKEEGIVGITFIRGQDDVTANHHEFERLLQRCRDYFGT